MSLPPLSYAQRFEDFHLWRCFDGRSSVNWEATPADVGLLIHAHPTLSELFGESALALTGRSLHG